jgi:putative DNA methylase
MSTDPTASPSPAASGGAAPATPGERAIERRFPIVRLNPLSVRERNAFKPVYKMHKWFARRSSSIFRAILLGAALPAEQDGHPLDLMDEFYRGHGDDPRLRRADGTPMRVLDPFMGGGTTVVEALRLGFDVVGNDLNPIAWFIVRGETTPVDLAALDAAYRRVAVKVRDELLGLYKTRCPLTGKDADIIYGFWVKQGICVDPGCGGVTDLFKSYEVARKRGDASLAYVPDVACPHCAGTFDWELDRCTITAGGSQVIGGKASGKGRPEGTAFAFALPTDAIDCPRCGQAVGPEAIGRAKAKKKTVPLSVLVDPTTGDFFEVRGAVPETVTAPKSGHTFAPGAGPVEGQGKFTCQKCGRRQAIVEAADAHGKALPFRLYGFYAYTPHTAAEPGRAAQLGLPTNNDKWFGAATADDVRLVEDVAAQLARARGTLPLPTQEIPEGRNFRDLRRQGYRRWSELYGPRQLLALGKLLKAIGEEKAPSLQEALLGAFQSHLDNASNLCAYDVSRNMLQRVTAAHDFRNPTTIAENNVWGVGSGIGRAPFENCYEKSREGLEYTFAPDLPTADGYSSVADNKPATWRRRLLNASATDVPLPPRSVDLVITDPPYAGSVQYAEMSDWSYVWLHHVLKDVHPEQFGSEVTLKSQEIIEDNAGKDAAFFFDQLTLAWKECHRVLVDDGLLVFTFHHREGDRWTGLLRSLFEAGFYLVAAYPTHSEALNSIVIQATGGITYDLIHVCRKRLGEPEPIAWSLLRREVTREARAQLKEIEQGKDPLPGPDVQMILLGKALMHFSRHYGKVLGPDGAPMDLDEAMERILVLVREVRGEELPLPGALLDSDSLSQIALLHVVGKGPWTRDHLHLELRGYAHGPDALIAANLVREVPGERGQLKPVPPLERGTALPDRADAPLIDRLHRLLATVQAGRPVEHLMRRWRGDWLVLAEALAWVGKADPSLRELAALTLRQVESLGPDPGASAPASEQLSLFGRKA